MFRFSLSLFGASNLVSVVRFLVALGHSDINSITSFFTCRQASSTMLFIQHFGHLLIAFEIREVKIAGVPLSHNPPMARMASFILRFSNADCIIMYLPRATSHRLQRRAHISHLMTAMTAWIRPFALRSPPSCRRPALVDSPSRLCRTTVRHRQDREFELRTFCVDWIVFCLVGIFEQCFSRLQSNVNSDRDTETQPLTSSSLMVFLNICCTKC